MARRDQPVEIILKPKYYVAAVAVSAIPLVIVLALAITWAGIHIGSFTLPYWPFFLAAAIPYYWASCFFIQTEEFAGVTVLEVPALELDEGFIYAPLLLTELERFPRAIQQEQFPGEPEQINKLPDEEADRLRADMLRPIRITTGAATEAHADDVLNTRLTLEPTFTVQWQVQRIGFFEFYIHIPGRQWPQKYRNLLKFLRDTGEKALNVALSNRSAAEVMNEKQAIIDEVDTALQKATEDWGITVCEVNVLGLEPDHATNQALSSVAQAKASAIATEVTAGAQKKKLILESEGAAQARINALAAEGKGLREAADAIDMSGEDYRAGEIAPKILGDKTIILGEDGIAKAMSIGKAILGGAK